SSSLPTNPAWSAETGSGWLLVANRVSTPSRVCLIPTWVGGAQEGTAMQMFELEGRAMLRSASGEALGEIESYVVDPAAKEVTHIVVEAGVVFPERRLVPTDLIDHIGEDGPV